MKILLFLNVLLISTFVNAQTEKEVTNLYLENNSPKYVNDAGSATLSQTNLFDEVSPSGYDLFNANLSFSDKDQVQKVTFSPLRLLPNYMILLSNLRLNLTNKSNVLTAGLSIGNDNSAYDSQRVRKLMANFTQDVLDLKKLPVLPNRLAEESITDYNSRVAKDINYAPALKKLALEFDELRLRNVIKYSVGYNAQFFSVLESKSNNSTFDSLNYHGFKGHNVFVNGSYSFKNGWISSEVAYNYFNKRKSADSTQIKNSYNGFSIGVKKRIFQLLSTQKLEEKDFYIESHFVPAIYLGFSYEQSDYKGDNYLFAEDNAKRIRMYSPYLDVCITPSVQFRFTLPIKNIDEFVAGSSGKQIGAVLSFNYKLTNLSN